VKRLVRLAFFFLLLAPAMSAQIYRITDLGPISPTAINTWSQVAGNLNGHAVIWTPFSTVNLGILPGGSSSNALAINDFAMVVGTADGTGAVISQDPTLPSQECSDLTQPFVWTPGKGMKGLGTIGVPGEVYWPYWCDLQFYGTAINDLSQVVGYTTFYGDNYQWAFQWTAANGMNLFGSSFPPTMVNGVTNTGQIIGQTGVLVGQATSWKNGVAIGLTDLSGGMNSGFSSSANGVSDLGQIVGWSTTVSMETMCNLDLVGCPIHAVLWARGGGVSDLGTLPGDTLSTALKVNLGGEVIGTSGNTLVAQGWGGTGGSGFNGDGGAIAVIGRPFIWSARNGMQDLNTRIRAGSGWVLNSVNDINIWGQIIGTGTINGQRHGFLLTP
jgi:probable HAF family extracellular repeat protein